MAKKKKNKEVENLNTPSAQENVQEVVNSDKKEETTAKVTQSENKGNSVAVVVNLYDRDITFWSVSQESFTFYAKMGTPYTDVPDWVLKHPYFQKYVAIGNLSIMSKEQFSIYYSNLRKK
jgi:hypothetical protein